MRHKVGQSSGNRFGKAMGKGYTHPQVGVPRVYLPLYMYGLSGRKFFDFLGWWCLSIVLFYYSVASMRTIFFFAFSIKLGRVFSGSAGTITIPLDAIKVCGSIGNRVEM